MEFCQILTPKQKALQINLDPTIYGSFSEIGAGQEVSRHFFKAGAAAGTIAKTISAYDMTVSDIIYGRDEKDTRYVSETRLRRMLEREFDLLVDRLKDIRHPNTKYFAFANTVATKSLNSDNISHGWIGVRFQHEPKAAASQVVLHIRMFDNLKNSQMDALGVLGVNLIYACYFEKHDPILFIKTIMDNLANERMNIDSISCEGPAFHGIDPRILALELVKKGMTKAIMFDEQGHPVQPNDELYKKNVLVLRGSWRPPTLVNLDMLECGKRHFSELLGVEESKSLLVLPEISMSKLLERGQVHNEDFLARVDLLCALGLKVLITNFDEIDLLTEYLFEMSKKKLAYVLGVYNFESFFNEENYKGKKLSMIGALGKLFNCSPHFFIYPENRDKELITLKNLNVNKDIFHLLNFMKERNLIEDIVDFDKKVMDIWSREVLRLIHIKDEKWKNMVPSEVAAMVTKNKLFSK
jgi:hypothetical protein